MLVGSFMLVSSARAQAGGGGPGDTPRSTTISPPAERMLTTPSGVDVRSGRYAYSQTDLSIGEDNETGGLALTRSMSADVPGHANPFANFSHNWDIMVTSTGIDIDEGQYNLGNGPDLRVRVHFGGRSETFDRKAEDNGFDEISRNAYATLTYSGNPAGYVYTFTANDGTIALFRPLTASSDCSAALACAYVSQISHADGTRFSFEYDPGSPTRLRAVTSNRGYALLLQYGSGADADHVTAACVINLALQPKPANNVCPVSPEAATSYSFASFESGRRLATATDAAGPTSSFTYARVGGTLRMGFLRPGDTSAWFTNTLTERTDNEGMVDELVDSQAFVDGSTWNFARLYQSQIAGEIPQVAGANYQDPAGNWTEVEYGFFPRPATFNPPRVQDHGYPFVNYEDVFMQITPGPIRMTDPLNRTTTWDYCDPNAMANLPPQEHSRCLVTPVPVAFTEPDGRRTDLAWDMYTRNLGRTTRHTRPTTELADIVTSATYSCLPSAMVNCAKPTTSTDARGNVTDYVWDSVHGGLLSETGPAPAQGAPRPQTRHSYAQRYAWISNGAGGFAQAATPVWVRTATSSCRTSAATGNPAAPCATAGDEVRTAYDYGPDSGPNLLLLRGQAVTATDGGVTTSLRTCYTYDARGRRIGETQPGAGLASCPGSQTGAQPYTANQRYDAMGRVTGTISADPDLTLGPGGSNGPLPHRAVRNWYDPAGRLVRVETGTLAGWQSEEVAPADWGAGFTPARTLETAYDAMGRKVRDTLREGPAGPVRTVTQYSYDLLGRLDCTAVRMNPAAFAALPASACVPGPQGSGAGDYGPDRIARNFYDAAGQRTQLRDGVGSDAEGTEATWAYGLNGEVITVIDGNGNRAELRYDGHGRQDRWTFPSTARPAAYNDATPASALASAGAVNPNDYEGYGYDANGNRISRRLRSGNTIFYSYDALNRMILKDIPEGAYGELDIAYSWDLLDQPLSVASAGTHVVSYVHDGFGRTLSETGPMGTKYMAWDSAGRMTRLTWPDGFYVTYDYLDTGEMRHVRESGATAGAGVLATFDYDPLGRRSLLTRGNGAVTSYHHDPLGRLDRLSHDLAGSPNDVTFTFDRNPASQIRSAARDNDAYAWTGHYAVNRAYTTNGLNQYSAAGPASFAYDARGNLAYDGLRGYAYTSENRLAYIGTGPESSALFYDPLGRLHQLYHYDGTTEHLTRFDNLGDRVISETYLNAGTLRRYVPGPDPDEVLVWYEGAGTADRRWLHADERGSTVAISDGNGAALAIDRYDEYGIPAATNLGRFQYTGQAWLAEIGLYHYKARVYSPTLGRFLQTDPVGYDDQFNLYEYVGDDPVNLGDPAGTSIRCAGGMCRITADTYRADRSTHQTTVATPAMRRSMEAQASVLPSGDHETHGYGTANADGTYTVHPLSPTSTSTNNWAQIAQVPIPPDAAFASHHHVERGENRADGMVDSPEDNQGYGDTSSLALATPIPYATIFEGDIGWHEIEDGQLVFTAPSSAISNPQRNAIQGNLNVEQRRFQTPRPPRERHRHE